MIMAMQVTTKTLTGAKILIETLKNLEVDTIFGYPGGIVLKVYDELYAQNEIKHIMQLLGEPYYEPNNRKSLDYIVQEIISEAKRYEPDVRSKIYEYIKKEQERIDNLLTEKLN